MRVLCGDIGGTKTELAVFEGEPGALSAARREIFPSADFESFDAILSAFDAGSVDAVGLGVAGPVEGRRCRVTNLPWKLDADALQRALAAPVGLINDFHAMALGVRELGADDVCVLQPGHPIPDGPVTVLGAGTGFGCAHLPHATAEVVLASEAGHADFAPGDDAGRALWEYARRRFPRVTVEHVLSGAGLALVFDHLVDAGAIEPSAELVSALATADDRARIIGERAGSDPACADAAQAFVHFYGAEAGNVALRMLPTGGLFIAGGIAPKLRQALMSGAFVRALVDKPPMDGLLARIPVTLAVHPSTGLLGARVHACMVYFRSGSKSDTP